MTRDATVTADSEQHDGLAPVIPLFGDRSMSSKTPRGTEAAGRASGAAAAGSGLPSPRVPRERAPRASGLSDAGRRRPTFTEDAEPQDVRNAAETLLLRRLRTRQLSISEARAVIVEAGMTSDAADELLARFEELGYLDDAALAEQLIHAAVERKGQGRQVIGPLLSRRGVPRHVVETALSQLPDDDLERALEFARTKARSLGARDRETALRRLLGQLARRGYPSSVAMTAARQALDEL